MSRDLIRKAGPFWMDMMVSGHWGIEASTVPSDAGIDRHYIADLGHGEGAREFGQAICDALNSIGGHPKQPKR